MSSVDNLDALQACINRFAAERDWEQFHSPKNLVMALVAEAGELVEQFQWLTPEQSAHLSSEVLREVELEVADVLIYLLRLCDRLNIDPLRAAEKKLAINAEKYPVAKSRGKSVKYDKL